MSGGLIVHALVVKERDECPQRFFVQALEVRLKTVSRQDFVHPFLGQQELVSCPRRYGFDVHTVPVKIVKYKHVIFYGGGGVG